jgi:16S rRNA (guanine1207-N2)-methyltransferase
MQKYGASAMSDNTLQQLLEYVDSSEKTLLVLDENASQLPSLQPASAQATNTRVLSNRLDITDNARAKHWQSQFSDFDFAALADFSPQQIIYRVSKEKRVVEHVLQSGWQLLDTGGEFYIAGYKNEGIKTFAKRAQDAWQCNVKLTRGNAHLHLYRFSKTGAEATFLSDDDYHALREIDRWRDLAIFSKPGIFAWDRFDEGSAFLLQHLDAFLQLTDHRRQNALDLGCGNGLLAVALHQAGCKRVVATDNNAAALRACEFNFSRHAINGEVIGTDVAAGIREQFDLVVCNPPFHQGFDVEQDLTTRFLQATQKLLTKRGRALFVVNSFISLEKKAEALFRQVQVVDNNKRFKLVQLGL